MPIATAPVFDAFAPVSAFADAPVPIATPSATSARDSEPIAVAFVPVAVPSTIGPAIAADAPARLSPPAAT
ncbi:hypothetical protein BG61_04940 [Caballeronia glathei]|uniref:Uncharacterized protein n=1 Tax=Caballeronia glathei TaxID=60547 RepID=A0A069PST6_9BURK|nr:hypothetical protein BG61_04940 [Caballeronia glathei]